jgi:hypothetical protein
MKIRILQVIYGIVLMAPAIYFGVAGFPDALMLTFKIIGGILFGIFILMLAMLGLWLINDAIEGK